MSLTVLHSNIFGCSIINHLDARIRETWQRRWLMRFGSLLRLVPFIFSTFHRTSHTLLYILRLFNFDFIPEIIIRLALALYFQKTSSGFLVCQGYDYGMDWWMNACIRAAASYEALRHAPPSKFRQDYCPWYETFKE